MSRRWLFIWTNVGDPAEVDKVIERLPRARATGYNAIVLSPNIAPSKVAALRDATQKNGMGIVATVMGGSNDRNYMEGAPVRDAPFVAKNGIATHQKENALRINNADFEESEGNHFKGWGFQDDEGVTTFADREVFHGGKTSLRMENIGKNPVRHCRISQPIVLTPFRQYHASVWIKSEKLTPSDPEVKILTADAARSISFQTFTVEATSDWKRYDIVFNSLNNTKANLYLGSWYGKDGKIWWDDLKIEEIGLVNVLRRPGCPVRVQNDSGAVFEEGRDYAPISDPQLHPWIAYHEEPIIRLTSNTRIKDGERLRVSYYHPIIVYTDRITSCLSEPKIFDEWRMEVKRANETLHPAAFLMSHDELRVMNWCEACQSKKMTPGELLAWNVRKAAQIIRDIRPDAGIWVWNDMFDPQHNAVDNFYGVNGSLTGSWKGLDKDVGIVNWHGGLLGKNCRFFADMGLKQILSGYYDSDEDGSSITQWLANTRDIPGIVGAMYTTWESKYDAMEPWAAKAWGKN
jgi:hypothetical protein